MGLSEQDRVARLGPPGERPRVVIDTDTRNEIDDQFALAQALLSLDRIDLEAIYAAPFHNGRSSSPADGMRRSLDEIHRILELVPGCDVATYLGSETWMTDAGGPVASPAAVDLIERSRAGAEPLYVVAIGAATNVASALATDPTLGERIVVVWLGGNALTWPTAQEFNLAGDLVASRLLFDSGVPLVLVPCRGLADRIITTKAEIDRYVRPAGPLGAFLASLYEEFVIDEPGRSKVIWDMAATGWVLANGLMRTVLAPSPILTDQVTWSTDPGRHLIAEVTDVDRDGLFADLFARLADHAS